MNRDSLCAANSQIEPIRIPIWKIPRMVNPIIAGLDMLESSRQQIGMDTEP